MNTDTPRPTDDQVRELVTATHYRYWMGTYPADLSRWAEEFVGDDGGLLCALGQWMVERARFDTVLEALFEICTELGVSTEPNTSGRQMLARSANLDAMVRAVLAAVRDYRRAAEQAEEARGWTA